jgi:hypothetical protein
MITVTYKCDRCGHEQDKNIQMWEVAVSVQHLDGNARIKREFRWLPANTTIWCRKCCNEVGLIGKWEPPKDSPQITAPTLEDQIREVIREEIEAATGGRA